jgi:GxxExxY protein
MLEDGEITQQIIGAAIAVHRTLGPGFLEAIYEEALAAEFDHLGMSYERQKPVRIEYRGRAIGEHRLDFLVAGKVIVELKALQTLEDIHFAIVRSYLKATRLQSALLLNFASMPLTIKRVGREQTGRAKPVAEKPAGLSS